MLLRCRIPLAAFDVDVDVRFETRVTAIFGPSGSGKTTLLDAIAGLRPVAAGEIELDGAVVFSSARRINVPPRRRAIGYLPQEGALFPHLSVRQNIIFGAKRQSESEASNKIPLDHVIEVLEIGGLLSRSVGNLSGGEAQRVALARAVLSGPRLLLLDEPLAALDIGLKERILPYLGRVRDEFAIPMIYVTHNLTEVLTLADWVLLIQRGKLAAQGVPKEIFSAADKIFKLPDDEFENILTVRFAALSRESGTTHVWLKSGTLLVIPYLDFTPNVNFQIRVSADDIIVATEKPNGISAGNVLAGTVRKIDSIGGSAMLTVLAGDEFFVRLTSAAVARLDLKVEQPVFLIIKTRSFRIV